MGWLPFNKKKSQDQSSSNQAELQTSTTVVQILVEETVMAVAQWLITFINRSIVNRPIQPSKSNQQPEPSEPKSEVPNPIVPVEELLAKFGVLVEQLSQREQGIAPLQNRIGELEKFLKQSGSFQHNVEQQMQASNQNVAGLADRLMQVEQQMQRVDAIESTLQKNCDLEERAEIDRSNRLNITSLDERLTDLERGTQRMDSLGEELQQANETVRMLEARISHLEKLLARFSVMPKLVEGNYRAIVSLQSRVENSQAFSNGNGSQRNSHRDGGSVIKMR